MTDVSRETTDEESVDLLGQFERWDPPAEDVSRETSPEPRLSGRFALFEKPDGGWHLSYRPDGADADEHLDLPGHLALPARQLLAGRGALGGMMRRLMGGRR